ncbi:hypothetical protein VIOR3934_01125 [Vibrio orientalis CIP 102891 = ATCC 33934]|uniref:Uncharacterized protein n=1 Tax=Vibrio orientalis CIP 102891 = ATCC 33934 TaxID=675816 RepID=F9SUN5_VIBOR|nr:hypothetical protein VIOR3934_01125 [Vibrio orientalis CIP 102891 = ATCC 33934]
MVQSFNYRNDNVYQLRYYIHHDLENNDQEQKNLLI